ncbi:MAG: gamma carbonic anhydrase family protein [Thermoplasmata archaeon]|nr:gamma carbonic anhydrase family protein [Thermoplasmata archaeon]
MSLRSFSGREPSIGNEVYIDTDSLLIGDVHVGARATVWPGAVLRADDGRIEIGEGSAVMDMAFVEAPKGRPVIIGRGCIISHGAKLHGCQIGDDVMIGIGAIVLDGATIESGSFLAAGSVVPPGSRIPSRSMAMGIPAKVTREVTEAERVLMKDNLETISAKALEHARSQETRF